MSLPLFLLTAHGRVSSNAIVSVSDWPLPGPYDYLVLYQWGRLECETLTTAKHLKAFLDALTKARRRES